MFHGHKYKVTILLLYYFPLICIVLVGECVRVGQTTSSSGGNYYSGVGVYIGGKNVNGNERGPHQALAGTGDGGQKADTAKENVSNSEDTLRREFIKVQILQRLGLSEKPHVDMAHKISKVLVLETLRRTENLNNHHHDSTLSTSSSSTSASDAASTPADTTYHNERHVPSYSYANNNTIVVDEETGVANYAKTSEIISFPDKGKSAIKVNF